MNTVRDFLAVAERGSVRAASRQLGVAQPAMTRSIHELEKELGTELFERSARGVTLTAMGEVFRRRAQALRSEMRRAQDEIDQLKGRRNGHLRICMSSAAHMALFPGALRPFRQRFPDVDLEVIDAVLPRVERELIDGTIDFYVGPSSDEPTGELIVEKLFDNERVVLARRGHPLAGARSLAELTGAEWITTSVTHRAEDELTPLFYSRGLPAPRIVVQAHSALTFFFTVAYSDMLMMLPLQWEHSEPFAGLLTRIDVGETLQAPPIAIVRRAALPLTPAGEYFCDMIRRAAIHRRSFMDPA
ncbi:LysR substrate-binding domain-containing protein [Variovorax sp. RKNM96]|uniref:LysR family transcriptional regulator n=1 Tax=Variovorax sp. RKNM96 TaxID=2681552 RepID=UPI001F127FF6|nr:LysR substrate-binding domain-containing protein [Variovorax sp. RKNM96]